jgi:hypothetical protein
MHVIEPSVLWTLPLYIQILDQSHNTLTLEVLK